MYGHIYGKIYDESSKKIINNANITSRDIHLTITMPSTGGVYFASGETGFYTITVSASNYKKRDLQVNIDGLLKRWDISLFRDPGN